MKQIAFITGSSRGIGRSIALRLAKEGFGVVLHGLSLSHELIATEKELKKLKAHVLTICFDVSNLAEVDSSCQKILDKVKKIDVLVNNSGISRDKTLMKMSNEDWDIVLKTNLYGPFYLTKALLPGMKKQGYGRIINISSAAVRGAFGKANYSASKAGLIGMTKSVALEVAKDKITVSAICPGFIDAGMSSLIPEKYQKQILSNVAMGRPGASEEVASLVAYLASKESSYITGAVIDIDGGWL